jgi:GAF domain-containing protein
MEFDERLRHALAALADSLHQEIAARLDDVRTELSESVHADRDAAVAEAVQQVRTAADQSIQEARAAADQAIEDARAATDRTVQEARAASEQAAHEARVAADQELSTRINEAVARAGSSARAEAAANVAAASGRLVEAIRAIDSAQTLSTIFDVLVSAATAEVGRAAVFLLQGASLKGWRLVGFDLLGGDGSGIEVPIADGGMIAEAAESALVVRLDPAAPPVPQPPAFADLAPSSMALAVPLVMSGQVFAVLYVDEGTHEPGSRESWPAAIEVLARHAARTLEAVTATKLAQVAEIVAR